MPTLPDTQLANAWAMRCMEIRGGSQAVEEYLAMPGLDIWISSQPHEGAAAGGDVYYVSLCGGGVITRLIVADVSGHGAPVADVSGSLRQLMRKNINTKSQTRLVRALNREFSELAQSSRFATAIVATYLATKQQLTVCNAGHPRPLWYRADQHAWQWMDQSIGDVGNLPLGLDDATNYRQFAALLGRNDLVLFYTDALIEAADPAGRLLGEQGLLDLVRSLEPADPPRIGRELQSRVQKHRADQPADDDTTVLILHHNASGPKHMSVGEKLDVYAKVFGLKSY